MLFLRRMHAVTKAMFGLDSMVQSWWSIPNTSQINGLNWLLSKLRNATRTVSQLRQQFPSNVIAQRRRMTSDP